MPCIYYGEQEGLTYNKREHVFPASLGCKTMLPRGWVSDQANEFFSKMEDDFTHRSLIAMDRAFWGPGQRGSLSVKKAAKTDVCIGVDETGDCVLSYLSLGVPYIISQFKREKGRFHIHLDPTNRNTALSDFIVALKNFTPNSKYIRIPTKELEKSCIVGYHDRKYYIAFNPDEVNDFAIAKEISFFLKFSDKITSVDTFHDSKSHITMDHRSTETNETSRICSKTLMNTLAYLHGPEFVQRDEFRDFREWILEGKHPEKFATLPTVLSNQPYAQTFPEKAHWCLFGMIKNHLVGEVCFYGHFARTFSMGVFDEAPIYHLEGFICDWENQTDYKLLDYILKCQHLTNKKILRNTNE